MGTLNSEQKYLLPYVDKYQQLIRELGDSIDEYQALLNKTKSRYTSEGELNWLIYQFYPALRNNLEKFLSYFQAKDLLQIIENAHEVILLLFKDDSYERYLKDATAGFSDRKLLMDAYHAAQKIITPPANNEQHDKEKKDKTLSRESQTNNKKWSKITSKQEIATALGLSGVYKLNSLVEAGTYEVKKVEGGKRQDWQIRIDKLPGDIQKKFKP